MLQQLTGGYQEIQACAKTQLKHGNRPADTRGHLRQIQQSAGCAEKYITFTNPAVTGVIGKVQVVVERCVGLIVLPLQLCRWQ